ncbi:hypothetical protein RO3G_12940 [Rhizopus delemar RA 99-880]|uniref:NADP-dependent oxidoreductase domain-containing protein n=1 Tax=Rhizopus delemar (strain RA 99-880 / ATCC MYA-4621 / FGSC 9543 / NRRL 43880) TaxID=246409 RepID=I1CIE9_RHIO9|nr:hypothetical protein RO3G_12940 [Rhizopus delemar RA 99-880]|eukprot:EIE88229.1 hypothetical protein RO3G_12940 [Rhizopus delemar RA 99-880]
MKTKEELMPIITEAVLSGYRLVDSATVYKNEEVLGAILKDIFADPTFKIQRKDLFITSKLSVNDSLQRFGLEYFDLYLIHWPGTSKKQLNDPINAENRIGSYKALEQLYREGKVKQIGVSNFTLKHLNELLQVCEVIPHVHQFELHPCLYQPEILEICQKNNIQVQAYSSLGEGKLVNGEVKVDGLEEIAQRLQVSPAVVLLRWAVQHDWIIIPKSKTPERVKENARSLEIKLSEEDMKLLDNIHKTKPYRFCWDPTNVY